MRAIRWGFPSIAHLTSIKLTSGLLSLLMRSLQLHVYGSVDHSPENPSEELAWRLYRTAPLTRLRDISLSSTPARFIAHGMAASRFQHSVGVGLLARKLCDWRPSLREHRHTLLAAALCHDIGSPPFSHISELFQWDLLGRTHEEETRRLLAPGREISEILVSEGVNPKDVTAAINGEDPLLGRLIAGSIDLDNIDNSLHLLVSLGHADPDGLPYHPLSLIKAFRFSSSGEISLDTEYLPQALGWARARRSLYSLLHSEAYLSSATMLYRAIESAYSAGKLKRSFFSLGESEALYHLQRRSGKKAAQLITKALSWHPYRLGYQELSKTEDPRIAGIYADWKARKSLCDQIAAELEIPPVDIALYIGRDRGEKPIELPWSGEHSKACEQLFSSARGPQRVAVFLAEEHSRLLGSKRLSKIVERAISDLPADSKSEHVFF